jgi:beta-lactamase class A
MELVRQRLLLVTTAIFVGLSLVLGTLYLHTRSTLKHTTQNQYPLLAKRLFLEKSSDIVVNFEPLRKDVKSYLASTGLTYSFYFEYLFTGTNIRIGENNKLVGASLMKIPIVMDLYKAAEQGKIDLNKNVTVPKDSGEAFSKDLQYGNQMHLKAGDQISLRKAAKIALVESDNTAAYTVFEATKDLLPADDQAINNLGVETRVGELDQGKYALIDARSYSTFLKCLYFSCFLSLEDSQEILNHLTVATDRNRIPAGVPKEIKVAHKFGSFSDVTQSDCGIVYAPNHRYVLCLMLDADDKTASRHIKKVSEMVYDYIAN